MKLLSQITNIFQIPSNALASLRDHQKPLSFIVTTLLFLALHQIYDIAKFPYDSSLYWHLSDPKVFINFPASIRGYFFPLFLIPARYFSNVLDTLIPYRIYSSVIYGFAFSIIVPSFYVSVFGGKLTFLRRMVVPVLFCLLFPGLILYPLSDLPAFLFLVGSLYFLVVIGTKGQRFSRAFLLLIAGVLAGAAYNTRPIYLLSVICVLFTIPFIIDRKKPIFIKIYSIAIFSAGIALISFPQALINLKTHGVFTPAVISTIAGRSLFASQLKWGITLQRYETSIIPGEKPTLYYLDKAGTRLYDKAVEPYAPFNFSTYFALVIKYPIEFIGIYGRHVINGLDLRDGTVYIRTPSEDRKDLLILNYTILFLGVWVLHLQTRLRQITQEQSPHLYSWPVWLALLLLPVLMIVPGAIETRFFLPVHFLIYCVLAFNTSLVELKKSLFLHSFAIPLLYILFFVLFCASTSSTMSSLQYLFPAIYY